MNHISKWLKEYAELYNKSGFVIGISGGVDSALTSTLCAETGLETHCLVIPILSNSEHIGRAYRHIEWLDRKYNNIQYMNISLSVAFGEIQWALPRTVSQLALANTKSRLRMVALYAYGTSYNLLVAGTGNKVEDYGIGFFTKYGDGGVDLSPIGDLTKTEVWEWAKELGINREIIDAKPSDDLWADSRSDESQIGAAYQELEWAMEFYDQVQGDFNIETSSLSDRQKEVLKIYLNFHNSNSHKMNLPPVCRK